MPDTVKRLTQRIDQIGEQVVREQLDLGPLLYKDGEGEPAWAASPAGEDWAEMQLPLLWGGVELWRWFRFTVTIPDHFAGRPVRVQWRPHAYTKWVDMVTRECLVYVNGRITQALDRAHHLIWLADAATAGKSYDIAIQLNTGRGELPLIYHVPQLQRWDQATRSLFIEAKLALSVAVSLPEVDPRRSGWIGAVETALAELDWREPVGEQFEHTVPAALATLRGGLGDAEKSGRPSITLCGHGHFDIAWLWTIAVSRYKTRRTFSTALRMMEMCPNYHFTATQPQLYHWLETDAPNLLERIKARIKEGRWDATGAAWVEMDCNLPSGESLVRQLLYGQRYFEKLTGKISPVLWLPDTFGFTAALPQICKLAGVKYFFTTKMRWNQINDLPHSTFRWEGLDGSRILAHMCKHLVPGPRLEDDAPLADIINEWEVYKDKPINSHLVGSYGSGDGGGGPTRDEVDTLTAASSLSAVPRIEFGTAEEAFERIEANLAGKSVPIWRGELYAEFHRATLTTRAWVKKINRQCEQSLRAAEMLAAWAVRLGETYPKSELERAWKLVLLNQFHDIIPGSSIGPVYEDAKKDYAEVQRITAEVMGKSLQIFSEHVGGADRSLMLVNSLSHDRNDPARVEVPRDPTGCLLDSQNQHVPCQVIEEAGEQYWLVAAHDIPAMGYTTLRFPNDAESREPANRLVVQERRLENNFWRIEFDADGRLTGVFDKQRLREVLPAGAVANELQFFHDRPLNWESWDVGHFYEDSRYEDSKLESIEVLETGPVRCAIRQVRTFRNSRFTQDIRLYADSPRIEFATRADWREQRTLCKTAFPVDIRAENATYDIQFGNIQRPTHRNTSWDFAKYEVCGHQWADLSEGDYGVSLLNDCKYGYDCRENVMRLTLLRGPMDLDKTSEQGEHAFTYALLPHAGDWRNETIQQAAELNAPVIGRWMEPNGHADQPPQQSLIRVNRENVLVDAVKVAEDGDGYIIRLHEGAACRCAITLSFVAEVAGATEVDLLERPIREHDVHGRRLTFEILPYEIKTFRVKLA